MSQQMPQALAWACIGLGPDPKTGRMTATMLEGSGIGTAFIQSCNPQGGSLLLLLTTAFPDANYTLLVTVEDPQGQLQFNGVTERTTAMVALGLNNLPTVNDGAMVNVCLLGKPA